MVLACLIMIASFSRQPSQEQDLRPIISKHQNIIKLVQEMPQLKFHYAGRVVDSHEKTVDFIQFIIRKCAHLFLYGCFGILLVLATGGFRQLTWTRWLLLGLFLAAVAIGDEVNQSFASSRTGCIEDIMVDITGYIIFTGARNLSY